MQTITLTSQEIQCEGCAESVTRALQKVAGVKQVQVDVPAKKITVEIEEPANEETIKTTLDDAGFPPDA